MLTPRDILLARIAYYKEQEQKATKGPWQFHEDNDGSWIAAIGDSIAGIFTVPDRAKGNANASVIVAARNSWPRILDKAQKDAEEHRPYDDTAIRNLTVVGDVLFAETEKATYTVPDVGEGNFVRIHDDRCVGCDNGRLAEDCPVIASWLSILEPPPTETLKENKP